MNGFRYPYRVGGCVWSREGGQVHGRVMANEYCADVFVRTNLVNWYAASGEMMGCEPVDGRVVVDGREGKWVLRKCVCVDEFGYVRRRDVDKALRIFYEMPEMNVISWLIMNAG
ncbi:hypothetical protein CK203_030946 [Vitis vinifera]|uniref:Pentatricopeptide repeat-containing protein n=1 Tax=Vitis vinifera TaxID=29760 RepID=A0A438I193_VITVI|nr:hypothetical protein CK203_030946 [Vitis vinifera]